MKKLVIGYPYWLASRTTDDQAYNYATFAIYFVYNGLSMRDICFIRDNDSPITEAPYYSVRPIVLINYSLVDNVTGSGTALDPYAISI